MVANTPELQNTLVSYYVKQYKAKHGKQPLINRQKGTWTMKALLYDYSTKEIKELIDFYLDAYKHNTDSLDWFGYNYEKVVAEKIQHDKNVKEFKSISSASAERKRRWKERIERVKSNQSGTGQG